MIELRCHNRLHGKVEIPIVEIACRSARCGKQPGNVVIHRFNVFTGQIVDTRIYQNPTPREVSHDTGCDQGASLRSA